MVETHAFNVWLQDSVRQQSWYTWLKLANGFVAPSFLFLAGVSFIIVADKNSATSNKSLAEFFRQFAKYLWILVVGYCLHLPAVRFRGWMPYIPLRNMQGLSSVDILHTIAVGLIVLLLLWVSLRRIDRVRRTATAMVVLIAVATPFLWKIEFSKYVPLEIANYINGLHNPRFPLFPWVAYLFAGAAARGFLLESQRRNMESARTNLLLLCGVLLFAAGYFTSPYIFLPYTKFSLDSPQWLMMHLGVVMIMFCSFRKLESAGITGGRLARLIGRESLLIYVWHLVLIYWITGPKSRFHVLQYRSYDVLHATALLGIVLLTSVLAAWIKRVVESSRKQKLSIPSPALQT